MGAINLAGALVVEPDTEQGIFPGGSATLPLVSTNRDYAVASPAALANINSASAYVQLPGVGTAGPVTRGLFLYVRTEAPMKLRLTTVSESQQILPVNGLFIHELVSGDELTLLEIEGVGRVEYLIAGQT